MSLFTETFGREPQWEVVAPGRVNLIGEHTDYNGGFVFPAAISRHVRVSAASADGPTELLSDSRGPGTPFEVAAVVPPMDEWTQYPAGVAWVLRQFRDLPNVQATVESDLPQGSGVSSSAAIEMAFACLWNRAARLDLANGGLALLAQKAENAFVGVPCGIMDQMASAMGRAGHAMFLDTRTLRIEYAPLPADLAIVLLDTNTPRALTEGTYRQRVERCAEAAAVLGIKQLRDATLPMLEERRSGLSEEAHRRARHVIGENQRCLDFLAALQAGDRPRLGALMRASHESLRDDYEVSSPALDAMAEAAWMAPGVVGARMTGAGFGGACVALAEKARLDDFLAATAAGYIERTGREPNLDVLEAVDGARVL